MARNLLQAVQLVGVSGEGPRLHNERRKVRYAHVPGTAGVVSGPHHRYAAAGTSGLGVAAWVLTSREIID
jgi:hypothetical protein